jgi:hypothetical protein
MIPANVSWLLIIEGGEERNLLIRVDSRNIRKVVWKPDRGNRKVTVYPFGQSDSRLDSTVDPAGTSNFGWGIQDKLMKCVDIPYP